MRDAGSENKHIEQNSVGAAASSKSIQTPKASTHSPAHIFLMAKDGWIKLWRKSEDWCFWKNSVAVHLWMQLLIDANHEENKKYWFKGEEILLQPGQFVTGRIILSQKTGIAQSTIEDWLRKFEKCQQIRQQTGTRNRLITIEGWNTYQSKSDNKPTTSRHNQE